MDSWAGIAADLTGRLQALPDDGWVTLSAPARVPAEPAPSSPRRGGLLGRLRGRSGGQAEVEMFVQFRRQGTYLYAECVGGPSVGGPFPWTDAEHEALLSAGWRLPPQFGAPVYVRFFPADDGPDPAGYLTGDRAAQAADLAVRTVRDLGGVAEVETLAVTSG